MDFECQLCGRQRRGIEWHDDIPYNPGEVEEQIHHLELMQSAIRSDPSVVVHLIESNSEFCPMCKGIVDGLRDESDEEELDTRITFQVAYLEDQIDKQTVKHM